MGHEAEHSSSHEPGGGDPLDMSKLPPKSYVGIDDNEVSTTGGWTTAKRFSFDLTAGKYVVIMSAQCRGNSAVQTTKIDITDHLQIARWWGDTNFENKTMMFILDATEKTYNFDFIFRRYSGSGTAFISDMRIAVYKISEVA